MHLGEALWHPATSHGNSSTRLDILNSSAGVVDFHVFPCFLAIEIPFVTSEWSLHIVSRTRLSLKFNI